MRYKPKTVEYKVVQSDLAFETVLKSSSPRSALHLALNGKLKRFQFIWHPLICSVTNLKSGGEWKYELVKRPLIHITNSKRQGKISANELIRINKEDANIAVDEQIYRELGYDKQILKDIGAKPEELILDLGCGSGNITRWLQESGCRVVSLDFVHENLLKVREFNPWVVEGLAQRLPFPDDTFDRVVFVDILEHIPKSDENDVIKEIYRVLKPHGIVYVDYPGNKIPNIVGYRILNCIILFVRIFSKNVSYRSTDEPDAHVNLDYPHRINRLFYKHGFEGHVRPKMTKFLAAPEKLRRVARVLNVFPLNYLFSKQMKGKFRKPRA